MNPLLLKLAEPNSFPEAIAKELQRTLSGAGISPIHYASMNSTSNVPSNVTISRNVTNDNPLHRNFLYYFFCYRFRSLEEVSFCTCASQFRSTDLKKVPVIQIYIHINYGKCTFLAVCSKSSA